jgi:hypothetical protein
MCRAEVKSHPCGDVSISLNMMLSDEPLALYINPQTQVMTLKLSGGKLLPLKHNADCDALSLQNEITIESFIGGFLAAGYRVSVRKLIN